MSFCFQGDAIMVTNLLTELSTKHKNVFKLLDGLYSEKIKHKKHVGTEFSNL